jgi:hypothetical protein
MITSVLEERRNKPLYSKSSMVSTSRFTREPWRYVKRELSSGSIASY